MRLQQLSIKPRIRSLKTKKAKAFGDAPHRVGVISKVAIMTPRKPNSARRTLAKVRLL
jgi:ribosomal protein S12